MIAELPKLEIDKPNKREYGNQSLKLEQLVICRKDETVLNLELRAFHLQSYMNQRIKGSADRANQETGEK